MRRHFRLAGLSLAMLLIVAACGGGDVAGAVSTSEPATTSNSIVEDTSTTEVPESTTTTSVSTTEPSQLPQGSSALQNRFAEEFPEPLVDPRAIFSGGPPPDGIPPIDDPQFVDITTANEYLNDAEAVVVLEIDGDARAYPVQVLVWHEIVNDTVGGVPVSVTYCPLCNSAVAYRRVVRGVETTFGTSGSLYNSALVMYDRATESLWTHFDGIAVVGLLAGDTLEPIGSPLMAWGQFKELYPDGSIVDRARTGASRSYGTNPYVGYDNPDGVPFLFNGPLDDRARAQQRVVGIAFGDETIAISLDVIRDVEVGFGARTVEIAGTDLAVLWEAGQASALDGAEVFDGAEVGSVGVFVAVHDGAPVTIEADALGFTDRETGSRWSVAGSAREGELAGATLQRVPHLDTFWFAWSSYQPGTGFIEE